MTIAKEAFGELEGRSVDAYTVTNGNGLSARFITFGARLVSMHVPDRERRLADIVLGFDDFASYVATDHYFGATCGRYGNRIKEGRFMLDGEPVQVRSAEHTSELQSLMRTSSAAL